MWLVIGTIAIVVACVTGGLLLDRRFGLLPRRLAARARPALPPDAEGATPATAIYATADEIARLRSRPCAHCRTATTAAPADDARVQYAGRTLVVLAFTCGACARRDRVYVEPRDA